MQYLCAMFRRMLACLFFAGCCAVAHGQNASNPFELLHRLPKEVLAAQGISLPPANPFDVVEHQVPGASTFMVENSTEAFNPFAILPKGGGLPKGVLATLLVAMLGFLTFSVAANRNAVGKAWGGFLNENGFSVAQREASGYVGNTPYQLLYVNFLLNAGMFIFLVTQVFFPDKYYNLGFLLLCIGGATGVLLSKHLMIAIMRTLFPLEAELRKYNFLIIIFNCMLGLFLVPFNLLIAFSATGNYRFLLVFWMLGLVAIFYLYRALRASAIGAKFLGQSPFHILLYLCAVEIAPVLLLVKLALMQTN